MRFLIIRLSSIGDIVHTLPSVSALAKTFPGAEIHWVVEARHAVLLDGNPSVHRVVEFDTLGWRKRLASPEVLEEIVRGVLALREDAYDAAIDFQGLYKSAIISRLSRSRQKLGFADPWLREPAAGVFYNERVSPHGCHVIDKNFSLVERLGVPSPSPAQWEFPLPRTAADDGYVENQLAALGVNEFMVMNPGGGWQAKRWAPEQYADLIRRLGSEFGGKILLTGSPQEEVLIEEILTLAGSRDAHYFPATLVQFIALVRRARLFLAGDTGPLHLAAAVSTPIVAIFGATGSPNTPERNGPFFPGDITLSNGRPAPTTQNHKVPHYIEGVTVDAVLTAIGERLERAHG
ncbi:MAG: glycosyltransferase family 9 protein [Terriglobia bacterium]